MEFSQNVMDVDSSQNTQEPVKKVTERIKNLKMAADSCSQVSTQQMPTQDLFDSQINELDISDCDVWGRLLSRKSRLPDYALIENSSSFGRAHHASWQFKECHFKNISVLSKIHFVITRELEDDGRFIVILEDKSQNGTFINSKVVGKNKKRILNSNDEIALADIKNNVFVFYNCCDNDSHQYPVELTAKYTMTRTLGAGTFGEVKLAYSQGDLRRVAVKIMKKKRLSQDAVPVNKNKLKIIENETSVLRKIDHPCVVKFLDCIDTEDKLFLVMEIAEGGELFDRITQNGFLKEPIAKFYFHQLLIAIKYLHDNKITHRDIKPENILLETEDVFSRIKLTDFGLSKISDEMHTICGTQLYMSPELMNANCKSYTNKVDMWSLGVVLFACLVGFVPFKGDNEMTERFLILKGKYSMDHPRWNSVSQVAKDLVRKLIVVDPAVRLSAEEALAHPWFEDPIMQERVDDLFNTPSNSIENPIKTSGKRPLDDDDEITSSMPEKKTPKLMNGIEYPYA